MNDLISRQAAIDVADAVWGVTGDKNVAKVWDQIKDLPSVQPEILACGEGELNVPDTNVGDMIHRQAAIDALESGKDKNTKGDIGGFYNAIIQNDIDKLRNLPPAQPEKRTEERTKMHACDLIDRRPSSSCVRENDTISRRMAIDAIFGRSHEIIKMRIGNLPSAQPERKRGKWIEDDDGWDEVIWRCSECDAVFTLIDGTPKENEYYFCPHCGADMRGEQDG